ncbi:hypothetical protein K3148_03955 [Qipengyuania aurantiaca]|uniref:Integrase n=1 Tax=Qipengyuania aurantiaca TaxID=2867233 RepID=A0ABX8ZNH2_9SPHN|nr:VPA1269 family protein [Qipengyuania aurantiaca]QZD90557.1 hypothetical protein K3148_03955 [Qipengyuania aurantiaca]
MPAEDGELETFENDQFALINTGSSAAVLNLPPLDRLGILWEEFLGELRTELLALFTMTQEEVAAQFGQLGTNKKNNLLRQGTIFGISPRIFAQDKGLARVKRDAAVKAIIDAKLLSADECGETKFKPKQGLAKFLSQLSLRNQKKFISALLSSDRPLDEILQFAQGCAFDAEEVDRLMKFAETSESFLQGLSDVMCANLEIPTQTSKRKRNVKRKYAATWFSAYLAKREVWLLPLSLVTNIREAFPNWTTPLLCGLLFPANRRDFAAKLMKDHLASGSKQSDPLVVFTALKLSWSSNIWQQGSLCAGPLLAYKKFELSGPETSGNHSSTHRSWAANRLWDAQLEYFALSPLDHPDSHAFVIGKRLVSKGRRLFEWIRHPNSKNLKDYERIYGTPPRQFPRWLVAWTDALEELLPLFNVESINQKIGPLNLWLLYLIGCPNPPKSFSEISREQHIVPSKGNDGTDFISFLTKHYQDNQTRTAGMAMSALRQAWALAAEKEGFASTKSNPVDSKDSPIKFRPASFRTSRRALDAAVADIIIRENSRDDMAFARGLGPPSRRTCNRKVRCPYTGEIIEAFFPAAPILVHVILHTGMRGLQAIWLDSGEGDEESIDAVSITSAPNDNPIAIKGRREGFLRICHVFGDKRSEVIGMWVNSGKSGPHEVPWVHENIVEPIRQMIAFQKTYYPIFQPVEIDNAPNFDSRFKKKKGSAFPLFRDPVNKIGYPISKNRLFNYYTSLLKHCQPIVDKELGYHYPLFSADGTCLYDLHSLRVTVITTLLDHGVPAYVVQCLVGHKSLIMTWYYYDSTDYKVHSALQAEFERRKRQISGLTSTKEIDQSLYSDAVSFRDEQDYAGVELLKSHCETKTSFDVFSHGVCPSGDCNHGGKRVMPGKYAPVWRPRACSFCRYRVTGPAFLNGLVQRSNTLLWEIKTSVRKEKDLYCLIEDEEDAGREVAHLRSSVRQEQELRDHLFEEWALEVRTIMDCNRKLKSSAGLQADLGTEISEKSLTTHDSEPRLREVHDFELAQRLSKDAEIVHSALELPPDVILFRDKVLNRIANTNDVGAYFFNLKPETAKKALDLFGELLVTHCGIEELDALIEGTMLIEEIPELRDALVANNIPSPGQLPPPANLN